MPRSLHLPFFPGCVLSSKPGAWIAWQSEWKSRRGHLVFPGPIATGELESFQVFRQLRLCVYVKVTDFPPSASRALSLQQTNKKDDVFVILQGEMRV